MFEAIILGIVEGLTEFIPVSSTGHLILVGHLLGFTGDKAETFEIFIQLGAILAVVVLYWDKFMGLLNFKQKNGFKGTKGLVLLALTTLPAAIIGLIAHDFIKNSLFNTDVVMAGLFIGGAIMLFFEAVNKNTRTHSVNNLDNASALKIGIFQIFSLIPGVSRSASTIIGGMASGLDRETAAEYSFIAAVPVMILATGFELYKSMPILNGSDLPVFAVGFITAFLVAIAAIKFFVGIVKRYTLKPFAFYRIAFALLLLIFLR